MRTGFVSCVKVGVYPARSTITCLCVCNTSPSAILLALQHSKAQTLKSEGVQQSSRMRQSLSSLVLLLVVQASVNHVTQATPTCPWDDADLEKWSEASTWPGNQLPQEGAALLIPAGKKILLDTTDIPRLLSLTIDGTLVWGNVDGIRLETSYVLVNGEFHIGSEDCRFEKKADIFLYGKSNSLESVPGFGRKFLGAAPASTLEIHGKHKKSWTKLVSTVSPAPRGSCGVLYDSQVR
ncbi:transmembrane protein 2 [Elysia marginata]|uniref:Transmembrane protein 2 n=1 Tax=Elysia marginata TaxID=1093978 RepID=A0AAV4JVI7_9GAST|nr:transmembrane protein 2 [Elysia marginata]